MRNFNCLPIISLVLTIFLSSCSHDGNGTNDSYQTGYINVTEADLPDEFRYGNVYSIDVTVEIPSSCYSYYDDFNYVHNGNERLIYPIAFIDNDITCALSIERTTFTIRLQALQSKPYVFKFYQGIDSNGDKSYLTYTVPVNNAIEKAIYDFDTNMDGDLYH
ncbi:hypothetical protein [uncultured Croceitalea sp.]|uniref:hypothetical protein n=1 Tax=uncultured Croceitalea sp. TaxID=1798908 RepID=UPI00374EC649